MVWWLNLCVNLPVLSDEQIAGKMLILGVSVRMFLKEISNWINRLSKEYFSSPMWVGIVQSISIWIEQKGREPVNLLSLLELGNHLLLLLGFWIPTGILHYKPHDSQGFRLGLLYITGSSWFSSLQMTDCGASQFP